MLDFTFCSPTKFVFGRDTEDKTGELLAALKARKTLVHYGGGSAVRSGLLERVIASIHKAGIETVTLGGAQPNPLSTLVYEGIALCRSQGVDSIVAVGGGSAIDSAKAIATGACYEGDFWDFFSGKAQPKAALPLGVVLTIAAAGSEGSQSAVITQVDGMAKRGLNSDFHRPHFAVMNPVLTYTLPRFQTACGIVDMMAHVMERYFTTTPDVDLTDELCEALLRSVIKAGPVAMEKPDDYEARATLMWAGTLAHNNLLGLGRQQDWASHQIGHELSARFDTPHGAALSVIFPAWMTFQLQVDVMRFAQFAVGVMGVAMDFAHPEATAQAGIARLRRFWLSLGMPQTLQQLGAKVEDIPQLAAKVVRGPKGTAGFFRPLDTPDIEAILGLAASSPVCEA